MIEGESGIMAICPAWERPEYRPSKRQLVWPTGAKTLIFTADEPERLRGKQHEWLWADEVAAWRFPEAWHQAMFGLRLGVNPQAVVTTTPKPTQLIRSLVRHPHAVVTKGTTYDNVENLATQFAEEVITAYEGTRLGRQELLGELLLDEGLAYPDFAEQIHVVRAFPLPYEWDRFEHMDYGLNNPTAWHLTAKDFDGNLIVADEYYSPGLVSAHAAEILKRRADWWERKDNEGWRTKNPTFGDPTIRARSGMETKLGDPASVLTEFGEHGVSISPGNNDRVAGYARISELLRLNEDRYFPSFHPRHGEKGAPKLYIMDRCKHLVEQMLEAPIEEEGKPHAGEAIMGTWESAHGHAHASLRYGLMSRPGPSHRPEPPEPDDPREAHWLRMLAARRKKNVEPRDTADSISL